MTDLMRLRRYLVADPDHCAGSIVDVVGDALAGGITAVQLRAKTLPDRDAVALARQLRAVTERAGALLTINDRVDIALVVGANGVHLGVNDIAPADARALAPPGFLIGYSPDGPDDLAGASAADYYGIGPVFGTRTKGDAGAALGLDTFAGRVAASPVPVVGIGGINAGNARLVLDAGAIGVAMVSAILGASSPREAAAAFVTAHAGSSIPPITI